MTQQLFRQLFDKQSSTYTYLLGDCTSKTAILIDAVKEQANRDVELVKQLGFERLLLLSTHIHADHVTGNACIKELFPHATSYISKYYCGVVEHIRADQFLDENSELSTAADNSGIKLSFMHTPGHTAGCLSIVDHQNKRVFTGDALLIRGCGRTDFQGGSADALYESVTRKLFKLSRDYLVYPAHDYLGRTASCIGEEIDFNLRLGNSKSKQEFIEIMSKLNLAYPKMIDVAVPANLNCGYDLPDGKAQVD